MEKEPKKHVDFRIPITLHERVRLLASHNELSINTTLIHLIRQALRPKNITTYSIIQEDGSPFKP